MRELISTYQKKKNPKEKEKEVQAGNERSNIPPKSSKARIDPPHYLFIMSTESHVPASPKAEKEGGG